MSCDKEFLKWARLHPADVSAVGINDLLDEIERLQSLNRWRKYPDEKPEDLRLVEIQGECEDNRCRKGCDLSWFVDGLCVSWHVKNIKQWRYFEPPLPPTARGAGMKPEDRKRLKQHIEMIVEHKTPIEELQDENRRLRLELSMLRFKESQEQRFIWWIWNVYSKNVNDLIYDIMGATTYDTEGEAKDGKYSLPKHCFDLMKRIDEYTEHIYDGTYLDVEISMDAKKGIPENKPADNEPSNSDVSVTQDVLMDIKIEDDTCPECGGCGEVAGAYFSEDGITTCDRCKGKGTI